MSTESSTDPPEAEEKAPDSFKYTFTDSVAQILAQAQASLWVSTYQAGKLAVFRVNKEGKLSLLLRTFDKAMGMALSPRKLAIGTRHQVWNLNNEPALAPKIEPKGEWDSCYLPRSSHVTGNIDIHELAWGGADGNELWFVNTLYSSLCTLSPDYSFVPRWHPSFISELRKHDRCHLNGLAMVDGEPAYVTAFAETNSPSGWRQGNHKREGGVVIDVASNQIISRGLSMPHSPRYYAGRLWVLDSGNGRLVTVDPRDGRRETVAQLPGYTRGLTFLGRYAFIGLSRIRETAIFGGIPIAENLEDRKCGIWIVDIVTGEVAGAIEFHETVDEVFDVQVLPGISSPTVIGVEKDDIEKRCVIGAMNPLTTVKSINAMPGETTLKRPGGSDLNREQGLQLEARLREIKNLVEQNPESPKPLNQLGNYLYQEGRISSAVSAFERAIQIAPDYTPAHRNLSAMLTESGDQKRAVAHARKALELEPNHPVSLNNLGYALRGMGAFAESREALEDAVRIDPDYARAWLNLAQTCQQLDDRDAVVTACEKACALASGETGPLLRLGNALRENDRLDDAATIFKRMIENDPEATDARHDLGLVRQQQGDLAAARDHFEAVLAARPEATTTRRNLALVSLMDGDYEKGWELHESRLLEKPIRRPLPASPLWDGQPFEEDSSAVLLLHGEQGLGDVLQFVRFAARAREQSGAKKVILACKQILVPLLAQIEGIDEVVPAERDLPKHAAHASLMSLPPLLGLGSDLCADRVPYLKARPDLITALGKRKTNDSPWLDESETRVVISWQGDPGYSGDRGRSIPLTVFAALSEVEGVRLVSVQKGHGSEQVVAPGLPSLLHLGDEIDLDCGAFEETAALISGSSIVITSDTSLAHLAGALGVPVWVALAKVPDWRWGMNGLTSPWYPSMRLYRQEVAGDWDSVFEKMAADLIDLNS